MFSRATHFLPRSNSRVWIISELPVHCEWWHSWAARPVLCKEVRWTEASQKALFFHSLCSSCASRFLPWFFLMDPIEAKIWARCFWSMFYHSSEKRARTRALKHCSAEPCGLRGLMKSHAVSRGFPCALPFRDLFLTFCVSGSVARITYRKVLWILEHPAWSFLSRTPHSCPEAFWPLCPLCLSWLPC